MVPQSIHAKFSIDLHVLMIRRVTTTTDDNTKKPDVDYLYHLSELAFAVELALARAQEEDSVFRIKSTRDVYHVLTDKETLEKVLQQGLKNEHERYKDEIVEFLLNMKNRN